MQAMEGKASEESKASDEREEAGGKAVALGGSSEGKQSEVEGEGKEQGVVEVPSTSAQTGGAPEAEPFATPDEVQAYLNTTVVPALQDALVEMAKARPKQPLLWLSQALKRKALEHAA